MKLSNFYFAFISPLFIIALMMRLDSEWMTLICIALYYFYRVFLDFYKLKSNDVVSNKDIWKFALGIWSFIYFKQLYFE